MTYSKKIEELFAATTANGGKIIAGWTAKDFAALSIAAADQAGFPASRQAALRSELEAAIANSKDKRK